MPDLCAKCSKPMARANRRFRCEKCSSWFCPSCMDRFCLFCKGGVKESSAP